MTRLKIGNWYKWRDMDVGVFMPVYIERHKGLLPIYGGIRIHRRQVIVEPPEPRPLSMWEQGSIEKVTSLNFIDRKNIHRIIIALFKYMKDMTTVE